MEVQSNKVGETAKQADQGSQLDYSVLRPPTERDIIADAARQPQFQPREETTGKVGLFGPTDFMVLGGMAAASLVFVVVAVRLANRDSCDSRRTLEAAPTASPDPMLSPTQEPDVPPKAETPEVGYFAVVGVRVLLATIILGLSCVAVVASEWGLDSDRVVETVLVVSLGGLLVHLPAYWIWRAASKAGVTKEHVKAAGAVGGTMALSNFLAAIPMAIAIVLAVLFLRACT